jgi:hypothetical protein
MRNRELGDLYRWMADLLENEGGPAERAQAYRDTARWILGAEAPPPIPARDRYGAVLSEASVPLAVFDGVEVDDRDLVGA